MKKIHVLVNYGGALTNELRILPGVYDADAPELFGIGDYLVANGFARELVITSVPVEIPASVIITTSEEKPVVENETAVDETPAPPAKSTKQPKNK